LPANNLRRELLRRVVELTNFDACWQDDQVTAKGFVASIREIVDQKDAFTRMNQAREEERQARLAGTGTV
jgi:restriction system protein